VQSPGPPGAGGRCAVADLAAAGALQDRRFWHEDRLHLGPAGRRSNLVEDVRWVRRHFLPWVSRRVRGVSSGDGLSPQHLELVDVLPPARQA
jgi:hypothetical protein